MRDTKLDTAFQLRPRPTLAFKRNLYSSGDVDVAHIPFWIKRARRRDDITPLQSWVQFGKDTAWNRD
jgi:hypothetical protein